MTPPTAIDLFCGCGGLSTGLLDAGVQVVAGFDHESRAIQVYDYNHAHRGARGFVADLAGARGSDLLAMAGRPSVDLVVGGPPCQAFSIIGKQQGLDDDRGQLLLDFVRIVVEVAPQAFILENVPNLARFDGGEVYKKVQADFEAAGFSVRVAVLAAADYGVAQMRKRLFMVGVRSPSRLSSFPPAPTHGPVQAGTLTLFGARRPYPTVSGILDDLPDVDTLAGEDVPNHEPTLHSPAMVRAFEALPPGERDPKSHHDRLHPDRLAYTLRAGSGNFSPLRPIHHRYNRVVTVRESARIQGFSDDFIWPDSIPRLQQYRQVGNAVPPAFGRALGAHLARELGWSLDPRATAGDPHSRPAHSERSASERKEDRARRIRGASLGDR